jgi:hypothetical protein
VLSKNGRAIRVRLAYGEHRAHYDDVSFRIPSNHTFDGESFRLARVEEWREDHHSFYDERNTAGGISFDGLRNVTIHGL